MSIIQRLQTILLETGYFDTDRTLRALCVDQRVHQWRKALPHADSPLERVLRTVDFLADKTHNETGENGLINLLAVFQDSVDEEDMLHRQLGQLLTDLPDELATLKSQLSPGNGQVIPLQRPPRAEYFTNRQQELATILDQLQPRQTVTLCGPGGMGKTALAAEAIWTLTDEDTLLKRFPDGVIWYSFYTKPQTDQALQHIVLSLGGKIDGDLEAATQRVLGGKHLLLLLDGTEAADDLRRFKQFIADCGVIITSRLRSDAFDLRQRQDIPPLTPK